MDTNAIPKHILQQWVSVFRSTYGQYNTTLTIPNYLLIFDCCQDPFPFPRFHDKTVAQLFEQAAVAWVAEVGNVYWDESHPNCDATVHPLYRPDAFGDCFLAGVNTEVYADCRQFIVGPIESFIDQMEHNFGLTISEQRLMLEEVLREAIPRERSNPNT